MNPSQALVLPGRTSAGAARGKVEILVPLETYSRAQLDIIKATILPPRATDFELAQAIQVIGALQANPYARQVYFIRRKGKLIPQCGIDFYVTIAQRTGDYAGCDEPVWDPPLGAAAHPAHCKVTARQKSGGAAVGVVLWKEYAPANWERRAPADGDREGDEQGDVGFLWRKMPYAQLEKCARAKALRILFGADAFGGVYVDAELASARAEELDASVPAPPRGEPAPATVPAPALPPAPEVPAVPALPERAGGPDLDHVVLDFQNAIAQAQNRAEAGLVLARMKAAKAQGQLTPRAVRDLNDRLHARAKALPA